MPTDRLTAPCLGIDLGGTKVLAALVDERGRIIASERTSTDVSGGYSGVLDAVVEASRACLRHADLEEPGAVGVGVAGQVEGRTGVVRFAPNLDWHEAPLGRDLESALGVPVAVLNDVRAATWGEWRHGAGRGVSDLVVLFVGTGIGGGVVTGGHLLMGCTNAATEMGHLTIVADGRPCHCPNLGCLEAYAGGWAIAERAREAVAEDQELGRPLVEIAGSVEAITAATVGEGYHQGDELALRLIQETASYLAAGIVGMVNALNPCTLVLGGGVIEHLPDLLELVRPLVREHALGVAVERLRIVRAGLAGQAGVIGAADYARQASGEGGVVI